MTMMVMMVMITCVRPTQVVSRHECRQSRPEISIRRLFYDNGDDDDSNYDIGEICCQIGRKNILLLMIE